MRREDREALAERYLKQEGEADNWFRRRLGVDCPEVTLLSEAILNDIDVDRFGIGWWVGQLGTKRRILIGDCLYQAVESIEVNLSEAKLHLLELAHWDEIENQQNADTVYVDPATNKPRVRVLPPSAPVEQLPDAMSTLHVVGVLQALNTCMDCFAGAIVGVCAVPLGIQQASFGHVMAFFDGRLRNKEPNGAHATFGKKLREHIAAAGPPGWLSWMQAFRNTNLHRGRRLNAKHLVQRQPSLLGPTGTTILRADTVSVLPAEPGLSEGQALLRLRSKSALLSEPAMSTLQGCLASTRTLIRGVACDLFDFWQRRRASPGSLPQPREQWPSVELPEVADFPGYAPGTASTHMPQMHVNPSYTRRLLAAAIDTNNRARWDQEFD